MILPKTGLANNNALYSFAGILPIVIDSDKQAWIYLGVEYVNNEKKLAVLAGQKDKKDKNSLYTAVRELNEESLDVFSPYIDVKTINDKELGQIDYNILFLLNTKLYLLDINSELYHQNCDKFIKLYNQRRYNGAGKYKRLRLAQRETYELRKVKLNVLIDYLSDPKNFDNKLVSYGGTKCNSTDKLPLRWSSQIILKNQKSLQKYL